MKRLLEGGVLSTWMLISLCTIMIEVQMTHGLDLLFPMKRVIESDLAVNYDSSSLMASSLMDWKETCHHGVLSAGQQPSDCDKETIKKRILSALNNRLQQNRRSSSASFVKSKFIKGQWLWGDFTYIDFWSNSNSKRSGVVYTLSANDGNELQITGYFDDYASRLANCMTLSNHDRPNYHLCDLEMKKGTFQKQENANSNAIIQSQLVCIRFEQDQGVKLAIHLNPLDCFSSSVDFTPTLVGSSSVGENENGARPSSTNSLTVAAVYIAPGQTSSLVRDFIVVLGATCAFVCGFVILCSVACGWNCIIERNDKQKACCRMITRWKEWFCWIY
ncbi:hypothetical protein C9374_002505 [Naegleria lovaniensis]|uniref:Uncharacterized protein n=1 Tax=Naegleria lovaniensis TaxID=51637 RepID=A0AA88GQX4_NAELO|nr:uncharacterized protein C9374_002505 [Naegleria lovaniensis]KAG2386761.1 hypothetical protein C9374_002505 [Naegleria lovaniensis]